jgi:hypothetical protein
MATLQYTVAAAPLPRFYLPQFSPSFVLNENLTRFLREARARFWRKVDPDRKYPEITPGYARGKGGPGKNEGVDQIIRRFSNYRLPS